MRHGQRRAARRGLVVVGIAGVALAAAGHALVVRLDLFRIAAVDVRIAPGGGHVHREEALALARVPAGSSLLALDLRSVADRVERHPWIEAATVRRELPDRLVIEVRERRAAAVVRLDRLYFADAAGRLFKPVGRGEEVDLPVVTGLEAAALAADPAGAAARLALGLSLVGATARLPVVVSELHVDPTLGFVLRTAAVRGVPGLTIVVGDPPFDPKLDRLERVLGYLAAAGEVPERVDLTLGSRAVVRVRAGGPSRRGPSLVGWGDRGPESRSDSL